MSETPVGKQCSCGHWVVMYMREAYFLGGLKIPAYSCNECGEVWYDHDQALLIDKIRVQMREIDSLRTELEELKKERWSVVATRNKAVERAEKAEQEIKDGDYWMERARKSQENGTCPACFATDDANHVDGCYLGEIEQERDRLREALQRIAKIPKDLYWSAVIIAKHVIS